jgi:predicted PurR-regulated permease PerM
MSAAKGRSIATEGADPEVGLGVPDEATSQSPDSNLRGGVAIGTIVGADTDAEIRALVRLGIALAVVALVVLTTPILASFSDIATIFFLGWLLAFLIRPLAAGLARRFARLSYSVAVGLAYAIVGAVALVSLAVVGISVAQSVSQLASTADTPAHALALRLVPLQDLLNGAGLGAISIAAALDGAIGAVDLGSSQTVSAVEGVVASFAGALGTLSIVVFMSVYIAADRDRLLAGIAHLVPDRYERHLAIAEEAISHSFGGFVRGQVVMGIMYGAVAFVACLVLGLPYAPLIGVTVAVLQTIPYFGPYVSWAPPVIDALLFVPSAIVPAIVVMLLAQVVLANLIQPRIIGSAVGLSPLSVLVAVLIGGKVAGVLGAIFSVPAAAAAVTIIHALRTIRRTPEASGAASEPASTDP